MAHTRLRPHERVRRVRLRMLRPMHVCHATLFSDDVPHVRFLFSPPSRRLPAYHTEHAKAEALAAFTLRSLAQSPRAPL